MKTFRPGFGDGPEIPKPGQSSPVKNSNGIDPLHIPVQAFTTEADTMPKNTRKQLEYLDDNLTDRDRSILASLADCRFMLTGQIQRLHVTDAASYPAAMKATMRELNKLKAHGLVSTLTRRIGGVRAGSGSFVWHITEAGVRLLNLHHTPNDQRIRYLEPSLPFLKHTLSITETYIRFVEICRTVSKLLLIDFQWEPDSWRPYLHGNKPLQLKPDMFAITRCGEYEDRWFIEMDLATESPQKIIDKCERYRDYYRHGTEQKEFGVFPLVLWIVPDEKRKAVLYEHIRKTYPDGPRMFVIILLDELEALIVAGATPESIC